MDLAGEYANPDLVETGGHVYFRRGRFYFGGKTCLIKQFQT